MKNNWLNFRMIALLCALPMIATAVASAQHFAADSAPLVSDSVAAASTSNLSSNRVHTISLNRAGEIEGRIASLANEATQNDGLADLKVFFVRDGEIAKESKTAEDGTFIVDGLQEGIYSFVATGKSGFAAYGVRVVGFQEDSKLNVMEAAAVSPRFSVVKSILEKNLPAGIADEIIAASRNEGVDRVIGANRVRLTDGQLVGQVLPMLGDVSVVEGTKVHIIQDDEQVAEVEVSDRGSFMVTDLEPGVYDFVAAGPSGFAAVSFQAVDESVGEIGASVLADSDEIPVAIPAAAQGSGSSNAIPADIPFDSGYSDGGLVDSGYSDGGFVDGGYVDGGYSDSLDVCLTCQQDSGFVGDQIEYAGTEYYGDDVIYDSTPIEYASDSLGCSSAAGGACGSCGASPCNSCGGRTGRRGLFGRGGGLGLLGFGGLGGGLGSLAAIGGLAGGIVAIADDNDNDENPISISGAITGS